MDLPGRPGPGEVGGFGVAQSLVGESLGLEIVELLRRRIPGVDLPGRPGPGEIGGFGVAQSLVGENLGLEIIELLRSRGLLGTSPEGLPGPEEAGS